MITSCSYTYSLRTLRAGEIAPCMYHGRCECSRRVDDEKNKNVITNDISDKSDQYILRQPVIRQLSGGTPVIAGHPPNS